MGIFGLKYHVESASSNSYLAKVFTQKMRTNMVTRICLSYVVIFVFYRLISGIFFCDQLHAKIK